MNIYHLKRIRKRYTLGWSEHFQNLVVCDKKTLEVREYWEVRDFLKTYVDNQLGFFQRNHYMKRLVHRARKRAYNLALESIKK